MGLKGFSMNKKLHVGNLSYTTTEDQLRQLFAEVGAVASVNVITDRVTGQSKGFGFVEMDTAEAAREAIERLNNHEVDERSITVSEARPPRERSFEGDERRSGRGGGRGGSSRGGGRRRY
jgi:RNA recognition motif-containing protein